MLIDWLIDSEMNAVETQWNFLEYVVLHYVVKHLHKFLIIDDWSKVSKLIIFMYCCELYYIL